MNPTLLGFIRKELTQALRDPRMRGMIFFVPVIQLVIFGFAISSEVRNIRLAVSASPSDAFTRRLAQDFYATRWFVPADPGPGDPFEWVRSGRAEAVLVAPRDGGDKTVRRGGAVYQLLVDATNAERARGIAGYAQAVLAADLKAEGLDPGGQTFSFSVRTLYNPEGDTATYMIPGTLCLMLCLVTVILTSMSMSSERELGTLETLLAAPVSPWEVLLGKTVPYVILGMLDLPLMLLVSRLMGVPIRGPLWEIFLAAFVFVCTTVSIGFLISSYMKSQQQAMFGGFLFLFPAIQLSGVIYPVENMPAAIRWIARLNPLRYFVVVIRHLMLKGGDVGMLVPNLGAMAALGAAALFWAGRRFRQTLN
ncbi:MAG TPA: ABC transporter permease [Elusimicrobiota bacterium]|nr:ABC transporter permease [Elusimicrobiota bacterium]